MKKLLFFLFVPFLSLGQNCDLEDLTYVPDDSFENYIETQFTEADNGIENDNFVLTSGLNFQTSTFIMLSSNSLESPIFDLTGIEDFRGKLTSIYIDGQLMSEIDLNCIEMQTTLDGGRIEIQNCSLLESIILPHDTLNRVWVMGNPSLSDIVFNDDIHYKSYGASSQSTIYINFNNNLCEFAPKGSMVEGGLRLQIHNSVSQIDLSNLNTIYTPNVVLSLYNSTYNQIVFNTNLYDWTGITLDFIDGLECVNVSDVNYCSVSSIFSDFDDALFSTDCYSPIDCDAESSVPEFEDGNNLIKTLDILGRENTNKGFQLHIYDDGSVEKKYVIK